MAKQPPSLSTAALIAATIITGRLTLASVHAMPAEALDETSTRPVPPSAVASQGRGLPPPYTVDEARWARLQDDYVLSESGQVVRRGEPAGAREATSTGATGPEDLHNYFGGGANSYLQCDHRPVSPEQIARLVIEAAQRHQVDPRFAIAVATAESRLDRQHSSATDAIWPMRLRPETAERFAVTDICDAAQSIDVGVRYLRQLTDEFHSPLLVAAAYHAGESRVREHRGIPPMPDTVEFVAEVLSAKLSLEGSNPTAYALPPSPNEGHGSGDASGVITLRGRRQWVGGVMRF
ncbi:lytic transglycosylase domain-containing protein [Neoaquamicrobium sediminum]